MRDWIDVTTTGDLLLASAERWPDGTAVAFPGRRATYAELAGGAWRVARGLHALGVRRGDHVGVLMPNCIEFVEAFFGIGLLGAVACLVNARYKVEELGFVIEHADHVVLLTTDLAAEHVDYPALLAAALPGLAASNPAAPRLEAAPRLRSVVSLGRAGAAGILGPEEFAVLADGVSQEEVEPRSAAVRVRDVGLMLYTSGTTARPKGCLSTHEALVRGSRAAARRWRVTRADRTWTPLPLFHHGALQPLLYTLDAGGTFCSMTHFDPSAALRQIAEERPTLALPTFLTLTLDLVHHPDFASTDTSSLRAMLNIGEPETLRRVQEAFPTAAQCQGTGLTEGGGQLAYGDPEAPLEQRLHAIGRPHPGIEVRIVGEQGNELPAGRPGELLVRSFTLFERYHKDGEATAAALDRDGWLHTGDLYGLDEQGWLVFHGRIKEMLKVGGENVAPAEIEAFALEHPAVRLAQAVGVPDRRLGEVPALFVELHDGATLTEDELIAFFRGRIASYRVPRHVRIVEEWPMSATKIQRFRLRDALVEELEASTCTPAEKPGLRDEVAADPGVEP